MKNKILVNSAIAISIIFVAVLILTNMFTRGAITGKLYRVDNVYEEIWNMVIAEKNGTQTILTTSIEGIEVDYDLGLFQNINIPINDEYSISLSFYRDELCIWLFKENNKNHDAACYVYNYQTNTLYGNQDESHLIDIFMPLYYSWVGNDGNFNSENQGDYTFVFAEYPLAHK